MSIRLISGIPGSGKTYYIVYHLLYGDLLNKYFVFHNIPELKIENKYIKYFGDEDLENYIDPEILFTYKYQKELNEQIRDKYQRNILWIIDECDKHGFGKTTLLIKEWLSMHRHLGQDIYLLSQSKWNIARDYMNLVEVEIQGKRGYLFNAFVYSWFSNGERISLTRLPKKKNVYNAYRSFYIKEITKKKSKLLLWGLILGIIAVSLMGWFIFIGLPDELSNIKKLNKKEKKEKVIDNVNSEINIPQKEKDIFNYAGTDGKYHFINDKYGNIYNINIKEGSQKIKSLFSDNKIRVITFDMGNDFKEFKSGYIESNALGASGRASKREREKEQEPIIMRELWINIY